jgi:hypothetical protein
MCFNNANVRLVRPGALSLSDSNMKGTLISILSISGAFLACILGKYFWDRHSNAERTDEDFFCILFFCYFIGNMIGVIIMILAR